MVPSGHRRDVAHETTALMREAIARVPLPTLEEIPDEDEMAARVMAGDPRFTVIIELKQLGFSLATLLAGGSVGGLVVGLAAQDT
jgi:hypothetical protein